MYSWRLELFVASLAPPDLVFVLHVHYAHARERPAVKVIIEVDIEPEQDVTPVSQEHAEYVLKKVIEYGVRDVLPARLSFAGHTVNVTTVRPTEDRVRPPEARCDHGCRPMTCPVTTCADYVMNFPL